MREHTIRYENVTRSLSGFVGIILAMTSGCFQQHENKAKLEVGMQATESPLAKSASYRDTIGSLTYYDGMGPMRVRGYGLVIGLGKNGSSDCPRPVYDRLVQSLYKHHRFSSSVVGVKNISPEQLIADPDTAVVLVQGEIPPAAVEETRFDVGVMALPGTQTKSLRGGRLFTADLEVFREVGPSASISGQVLAIAAGPVFLNPFAEGDAATQSNPLEGIVVGGGFVVKDRRVRLVLTQPSYPKARQIQDRINTQFSGPTKVADAISPSFIQLHVPPEYRDDTGHFLALVRSLYLSRNPAFEAARATALAEEIIHPTAPHAQISQCFEGLGRASLPRLNELYAHNKDYVSFHAAVAGMRLGDHVACDCLTMHAAKVDGEFRFQAIRALAEAKGMGAAAVALRKLLHDSDPRVQVAAYEALIKRNDPTIESIPIAGDNFVLDHIRDAPTKFIYVKRSGARRIALFGEALQCSPPVLYRSPDGGITMNAGEGDAELTILRTVVASGSMSPPIPAPRALHPLIRLLGNEAGIASGGAATGLGLDYGAIARALYYLCQSHAIDAKFILEQPNAAELFGPAQLAGRPESEL